MRSGRITDGLRNPLDIDIHRQIEKEVIVWVIIGVMVGHSPCIAVKGKLFLYQRARTAVCMDGSDIFAVYLRILRGVCIRIPPAEQRGEQDWQDGKMPDHAAFSGGRCTNRGKGQHRKVGLSQQGAEYCAEHTGRAGTGSQCTGLCQKQRGHKEKARHRARSGDRGNGHGQLGAEREDEDDQGGAVPRLPQHSDG